MILSIRYYFVAMDHDFSSGRKMETRFLSCQLCDVSASVYKDIYLVHSLPSQLQQTSKRQSYLEES